LRDSTCSLTVEAEDHGQPVVLKEHPGVEIIAPRPRPGAMRRARGRETSRRVQSRTAFNLRKNLAEALGEGGGER